MFLSEDTRNQILAQSKKGKKERDGKTRFQKRVNSKFSSSTRDYNRIDMNQLFKNNILTVGINIKGETDDYIVKIKFGGFLDILQDSVAKIGKLDLRTVIRALVTAFSRDDVYIHCSCPDFQYRFSYWATVNELTSGEAENRPADITNPNNDLGAGCKHIMLVLSNTSWIIKVGSVINNYINYMEKHYEKLYAEIIYPAVYGKKYEEPVQLDIDTLDKHDLDTDQDTIDTTNTWGKDRGKFKQGNPYRFQKKDNRPVVGQETIDFEDEGDSNDEND